MDSLIRIVIADDHPALTEGLQRLLEIEPDLKVIGRARCPRFASVLWTLTWA
jgi:DNA-binding NarL/FixJ family response regulator